MGWFKKAFGFSSKEITKPLTKILAAPITGMGSILSGIDKVSDWFKTGLSGAAAVAGTIGLSKLGSMVTGAGTGALGQQWDPAISPPMSKAEALSGGSSGGFLSSIGNLLGASGINLGSIVQGAVGLGSDYLSQQQQLANQIKINDKTFAQNQLLQQQAYNQNLAMWSAQNEYNAPIAQMARLKAAGLNPNLVYGGGNVTGNTASSAPQFTPAQHEVAKVSRLGNFMDTVMNYQQIQNQALQNDFTRARIELAYDASERANRQLAMEDRYNKARLDIMRAQLGYTQERSDEMDAWKKYQDALEDYHRREKDVPMIVRSKFFKGNLTRFYNTAMSKTAPGGGIYPSYMDYVD